VDVRIDDAGHEQEAAEVAAGVARTVRGSRRDPDYAAVADVDVGGADPVREKNARRAKRILRR